MHVIFVSQCEKRAIPKTRAIIDGYANRIGDATWSTPITQEALDDVRRQLRKAATRQTAVACYINYGVRQMKLLWTVGNGKMFGRNGEIAIATRTHKSGTSVVPYLNHACLVATYGGLGHDIGKTYKEFQEKLAAAINPKANQSIDLVRHEIVSAVILDALINGKTWKQAWHHDLNIDRNTISHDSLRFTQPAGIKSLSDAVQFVIATHHRLFAGIKDNLSLAKHSKFVAGNESGPTSANILLSDRNADAVEKVATRLAIKIKEKSGNINNHSNLYWNGISIMARASLVLADHDISSQEFNDKNEGQSFANTKKSKGKTTYNQSLSSHLAMVGVRAGAIMRHMLTHEFEGLCHDTIDKLTMRSADRFEWQNKCEQLTPEIPTLVFNVASTGAGKTRMNARTAAYLAGSKNVRLSIALSLRSLTLQTGDVYKYELGLGRDELAVIIGDTTTRALHEYEKSDIDDADIADVDERESILVTEDFDAAECDWLSTALNRSKANKAIAMAPILVSTIDYLIDAGDIRQQSSHPLALIRIMHSDLIIDEIDSYEPDALSAVLRVVKLSAMFGRNVITSSATLTKDIADKVYQSYRSGFEIYQALNNIESQFTAAIIDDSVEPTILRETQKDFGFEYMKHISKMMTKIKCKDVTKKAEIIKFDKSLSGIMNAISNTAKVMHDRHKWTDKAYPDKKISIGLVRVANIRRAIEVAKMLDKEGIHVCCYHSRHFLIQRFHIESKLDKVLKRKGSEPNKAFLSDPSIQVILNQSTSTDVRFVIVATPVEEVGRDHDFDWAIIEPSSAQSIVQTGGRVNRHRHKLITEANIALLQYNFNEVDSKNNLVFAKPGYELAKNRGKTTHQSHDLCKLIDESLISERFDADIRFNADHHHMSKYDNEAIKLILDRLIDPIIKHESHWMGNWIYNEAQLRKKESPQLDYHYDGIDWYAHSFTVNGVSVDKESSRISFSKSISMNGLFTLSYKELVELKEKADIEDDKAFKVSIYDKNYVMHKFGCEESPKKTG